MNLEFLYRFYVCANRKNITHASEELFISQPALSKNITELEQELGVTLFLRSKNGVILTPIGREIYDKIRPSIETLCNINKYTANLLQNSQKTIRIGITKFANELFLNNKIFKAIKSHKDYIIKIYEDKSEFLIDKLKKNELDIIFAFITTPHNELVIKEILSLEDGFFCSTKNKTINKKLSISDLIKLPLIVNGESSSLLKNSIEYFKAENQEMFLKYEINNNDLFNELLINDLAVGITSIQTVQNLIDKNQICKLNVETPFPTRTISLAYKKNITNNIKTFIDKILI